MHTRRDNRIIQDRLATLIRTTEGEAFSLLSKIKLFFISIFRLTWRIAHGGMQRVHAGHETDPVDGVGSGF